MMKKAKEEIPSGSGRRQLLIMFTALAVLGAGFAYYFFGYVKVKEDNLNEMGFRVLSRLGTNIVSKKDNVIKNAKNILRKEINDLLDDGQDIELNTNQVNANSQNKDVHFIEALEIESISYPAIEGTADLLTIKDTIQVRGLDQGYKFSVNLREFTDPLIREDFFGEFVMISNNEILYNTISSGFELMAVDSLLDTSMGGMQVSSIRKLQISGISYNLFLQPHHIDVRNNWIIGGLIRSSKYNNFRLGVSPVVIMFIFLITLLTVLSIPFLKLKSGSLVLLVVKKGKEESGLMTISVHNK